MSDKSKKITVTVPGVNLDKIFGARDEEVSESVTETKSRLVKKQEELESLELDAEILEVEDKIRRRRGGEPVMEVKKDSLGEKMVEQVVIPLVNKKLSEDERSGGSSEVVDRALRIAEKAVERGQPKREEKSALDEFDKGIEVFSKIRGLIEGEKAEKEESGKEPKKEVDSLSQLDKGIELVRKIRETFPQEGGGENSQAMIEFKKWEKDFDLKAKKADRDYQLEQKKIDKEHDARLAELGIEKERNELLRDGFKRVGRAVALALGEEDEYEEGEESIPESRGRRQLIKETCSVCGAEILIPPESQVAGKEIKCIKCNSIFKWE